MLRIALALLISSCTRSDHQHSICEGAWDPVLIYTTDNCSFEFSYWSECRVSRPDVIELGTLKCSQKLQRTCRTADYQVTETRSMITIFGECTLR